MEKTIKENKMGTQKMLPLIISMSLPAMFSMLILALYNIVDSIFVSRYSSQALSAVSLAYPLQMICISFAVGTAVGVNSLIARRLGAKNYEEANSAATHGMILALFDSLIFLIIGLFVSKPFISLFTQNETILQYGTDYITIVLCVSFGSMFACMIEKILQGTGNMIVPMLSQLIGAIINIILDPFLIFGLWIFPELGVRGAAIATVFGQICSFVFLLCMITFRKYEVKINFKNFKFDFTTVKNIYVVGLPAIIMQSIGSVMVSGVNTIITLSGLSTELVEGYVNVFGIYFKVQSFVFMPVFGLNQGSSPIFGYNYGANNKKRMFEAFKLSIIIAASIMAIGTTIFHLIPEQILYLFTEDPIIINLGISTLRIISIHFIFAAFGIMFSSLFQAVGKGFYSMIMSIGRQLVVLLPIAFLISKINIYSMWYAFLVSEILCVTFAYFIFRHLKKTDFDLMDERREKMLNK